jgi:Mlc titration factor MtfA (ptsG expression regulator)
MLSAYRAWRRRRILQRHPIDDSLWQRTASLFGFVVRLTDEDRERLRELCILFLHEKQISATGDLELDAEMKLAIAIQACILILNLGLESYGDWIEVIVYPDEFFPNVEFRDEHGLVQTDHQGYSGQAWLRGPVILSWASVQAAWHYDAANVAIHEFAHKLDMINGDANGFPQLHAGMSRRVWTDAFSSAYADLCQRVDAGAAAALDEYASESPAEFFAVASEAFFETPEELIHYYPAVYDQLSMFYRQDPASLPLPREWRLGR